MSLICPPNNKYGEMQLVASSLNSTGRDARWVFSPWIYFPDAYLPLESSISVLMSIRLVLKVLQKHALLEHGK